MAGNDGAASLQACAMRVARLAADGTTPAGVSNLIVTNSIIKLDLKIVEESGDEFTVKNACGGIAFAYKDGDRLKRLDGSLTITNPDVELTEMLSGGSLITSGGQSIGFSAQGVGNTPPNGVSLEVWTKAWIGGGQPAGTVFGDFATTSASATVTSGSAAFSSQDIGRTISGAGIPGGATILSVTNATTAVMSANATATATGVSVTLGRPGPYWRYVFGKFVPSLADFSLENGVRQVMFNGPIYENPNIGNGPLNDLPAGGVFSRLFSYYRDAALPVVTTVGYQATPAQV